MLTSARAATHQKATNPSEPKALRGHYSYSLSGSGQRVVTVSVWFVFRSHLKGIKSPVGYPVLNDSNNKKVTHL